MIVREGRPDDPRLGGAEGWTAEVLHRYPHCALAAYVTGPDRCVVRMRGDGDVLHLSAHADADADPFAYASSLYAWWVGGGRVPTTLRVRVGGGVHVVRVVRA